MPVLVKVSPLDLAAKMEPTDFALVLDGKGDEVREVRKRVLQFQYRDFRIALVLVGVVFIIGSCINLIII